MTTSSHLHNEYSSSLQYSSNLVFLSTCIPFYQYSFLLVFLFDMFLSTIFPFKYNPFLLVFLSIISFYYQFSTRPQFKQYFLLVFFQCQYSFQLVFPFSSLFFSSTSFYLKPILVFSPSLSSAQSPLSLLSSKTAMFKHVHVNKP